MHKNNLIPQTDPKAGYLAYKKQIDSAIRDVLESGWYILGKQVEAFEQEFASYIGAHFGTGVASGTDAIEIALRALDIGPGDLVFTVSHTAVATVAAIQRCAATPVFVDIDEQTFTMDPSRLESTIQSIISGSLAIKGLPKAIVPVHLYGHPADMISIMDIAQRYNLHVVEDCAQAHGAKIDSKNVGAFGEIGAFSFYPTKNLAAIGDGGAVVTSSKQLQEKLIALRQYGWEKRYISSTSGINSRLDEIQAAILRIKLTDLNDDNEKRKKIAHAYTQAIEKTAISHPNEWGNITHVYHQYVIRTKKRAELIRHLEKNSIATAIHYPLSVHLQPAYKSADLTDEPNLTITEKISQEILSLPMYPQMTDEQVQRIVNALSLWQG